MQRRQRPPLAGTPLPNPVPRPNKLPTYFKHMLQLWGEAEVADADADAEAAAVVAVEDVEVWDSNQPHPKTTITKETRRHPQTRPPKGGKGRTRTRRIWEHEKPIQKME